MIDVAAAPRAMTQVNSESASAGRAAQLRRTR
jgi:hypothetical protein